MTLPDMMRGRAPPRFHTETGTGTASGSAEKEAESETRREKGDAPALGTGGGAPGVETRMSGADPESGARTRTEIESVGVVGAGSEHAGSGSEKRSFELVMELLMMGHLESLALKAPMAPRRRVGIETVRGVEVTEVRGNAVVTETVTGIESTSVGSGAVSGAGMRPGVGVAAVRTMGWKG